MPCVNCDLIKITTAKTQWVKAFYFPLGAGTGLRKIDVDRKDPFRVASGQFKVAHSPNILKTPALTVCIALTLYDPRTKIGGLAHLAGIHGHGRNVYEDIIRPILREMMKAGAKPERLKCKLLGGSGLLIDPGSSTKKIIDHLKIALKMEQVKLADESGEAYDWIRLFTQSGKVLVGQPF
jgi:chemotaxis protein CheD